MTHVELCKKCYRPLWEGLCIGCSAYLKGILDAKKRKLGKYKFIGILTSI